MLRPAPGPAIVLGNAAAIANNGGWTGNVASNVGTIDNNKTWTGTVSNAGTFNNNAGATVSGLLTNTAGTTVNNGALNGGANVSGGMFTGSGTVTNLTVSGGIFAPGNGTPGSSMTIPAISRSSPARCIWCSSIPPHRHSPR